ncbi:hypothetical protein QVD17_19750 [Tagetes erecta]|uniref:Uncharacterized protein n=1 Tax=Tagetes erecta TaxID=13708 RepID=A0AAD8KNL3_TARER|nr:hypothetical protein QVD17_19750 [Tagetes erecta]
MTQYRSVLVEDQAPVVEGAPKGTFQGVMKGNEEDEMVVVAGGRGRLVWCYGGGDGVGDDGHYWLGSEGCSKFYCSFASELAAGSSCRSILGKNRDMVN